MLKTAPLSEIELARVVEETIAICAIPAPTFRESARATAVAELLTAAGLDPYLDAIGNVLVRVGGEGPALALCAHLDTVFPQLEPIVATRDGIRLCAPGIGDNALGVAALLHIAREVAARPTQRPILLAATVGEEGLGDLRGVTALLDAEPVSALVAIEGHGIDSLAVGGIASVRLRADYRGPGGHSWTNRGTGSAIHALLAAGAAALNAGAPAAVNIGVIEGGTSVNAIAEHASLLVDIRHADDRVVAAAHDRVARALASALPAGISADVHLVGRRPGGATRRDDPLLVAARAARTAVGLGPADEQLASTDANAAYARGIPAVGIGITRGDHAHRVDEWIAVPPVALGIATLSALLRSIAG